MLASVITMTGGLTVVVEADRDISYAEVESALNAEAWLESYLINRVAAPGHTRLTISVHVPTSAITAEGVPCLDAVQTLRSVADVLAAIDR